MNNVLILYPEAFKCYSKFSRKVSKILQNLCSPKIYFISDKNYFCRDLAKELSLSFTEKESVEKCIKLITHAIIFDDGEEFSHESTLIQSLNVPLRLVSIAITRVINIKQQEELQSLKSTPKYEYIGRGSKWGNPYSIFEIEDLEKDEDPRAIVINNFKYDFENDKMFNLKKNEVFKLAGKRLGCFCKPLPCHGDILADYLNSWDDGK